MAGRCGCSETCNCCTATTPTVEVIGSGMAGACHEPHVRFSGDLGNRARQGDDGAVYADTAVRAPNGDVIDPDPNGFVAIPATEILDYSGDVIPPNSTGQVALPPAAAPDFGDGLDSESDGTLVAHTSGSWPLTALDGSGFSGSADRGSEVYTDGQGRLRTTPDHTLTHALQTETFLHTTFVDVTYPDRFESDETSAVVLTNPSASRPMLVERILTMVATGANRGDSLLAVRIEESVNEGVWQQRRELDYPRAGDATIVDQKELRSILASEIPPLGSISSSIRAVARQKNPADQSALFIEAAGSVRLIGRTR